MSTRIIRLCHVRLVGTVLKPNIHVSAYIHLMDRNEPKLCPVFLIVFTNRVRTLSHSCLLALLIHVVVPNSVSLYQGAAGVGLVNATLLIYKMLEGIRRTT